ncbi:hypothetical protein FVE85_3690 [Porphyridium purpureum]|uniref:Uncharacterized protein n=1 Tax=Porphyridium purpureum TaxID=35688 RepID=A0A5J4YMJ4_PORPP|nr:hypothetical protein FVE85_3690 [Porphyridium purpureum]|eukprot:POR2865..scf249_10
MDRMGQDELGKRFIRQLNLENVSPAVSLIDLPLELDLEVALDESREEATYVCARSVDARKGPVVWPKKGVAPHTAGCDGSFAPGAAKVALDLELQAIMRFSSVEKPAPVNSLLDTPLELDLNSKLAPGLPCTRNSGGPTRKTEKHSQIPVLCIPPHPAVCDRSFSCTAVRFRMDSPSQAAEEPPHKSALLDLPLHFSLDSELTPRRVRSHSMDGQLPEHKKHAATPTGRIAPHSAGCDRPASSSAVLLDMPLELDLSEMKYEKVVRRSKEARSLSSRVPKSSNLHLHSGRGINAASDFFIIAEMERKFGCDRRKTRQCCSAR